MHALSAAPAQPSSIPLPICAAAILALYSCAAGWDPVPIAPRIGFALTSSLRSSAAGWDPARIARRIGFAVFGVPGTEANPTFLEEVRCWHLKC